MKKNIKIILASVIASMGVAASFTGAFALYKQGAQSTSFSIGAYTHTSKGTVTYKAGDISSSLGANKISPDFPTVEYKVPLGGTYSNDIPNQDFIYGNLKVDITIPEAIADKVMWCVYVTGYNPGSYWDANFASLRRLTDAPSAGKENPYVGEKTSVNKDVAVNAVANPTDVSYPSYNDNGDPTSDAANQWAVVYVDFSEALTSANFGDYAESTFKVDLTFDKVSSTCDRPQVYGDGNSWNKEAYEYGLVPNIAKVGAWEWEFKGITGFSKLIVYVTHAEYYVKNTSGEDLDVVASTTYDMYLNGIDSSKNTLYIDSSTYIKG